MPIRSYLLIGLLLLATSSSVRSEPRDSIQPPDWDSSLKLREARDINPDPKIVEVNLEARIAEVDVGGKKVKAWTYDGGIPGPLIRANVGDRLIVHFTNNLPESTTVHWHGIRVPNNMDGVPDLTQQPVEPSETFTYDFVLPDAGMFWYHPHVESATQVGYGLTGPLLVEDPSENVGVSDELVLVLSDIEINDDGSLASPNSGGSTGMAFGREGNVVLVNGKVNPVITVRAGARQRWRIVNTAKSRFFNVHIRGSGSVFTKIGSDGGLQEYPTQEDTLVLGPGERVDAIVTPKGKPGTEVQVGNELYDRGYGSTFFRSPDNLFRMVFANLPAYTAAPLPEIHRLIEPLSTQGATQVKLDLGLVEKQNQTFEYQINGEPSWKATPLHANIGETQIWTIDNTSPWTHPMHLHGFFFLILDKNGQPVRPLEWKDTVNVPYKETVKILVRFDDRPGTWMIHCHILDHAEGGLMTTIQVGDGPAKTMRMP